MGGADQFNLTLLEQLTARGWEVTCATTLQGDHSWMPEFNKYTQDVFALPHFLDVVDYPRFLSYLIQSRQIDTVLISNSAMGYQLLLFLRARFPDVTFLDYCHMEEPDYNGGGYPLMAVKSASCLDLSVVSSAIPQGLDGGAPGKPEQIEVCYTNVEVAQGTPTAVVRGQVRRQLNLGQRSSGHSLCRAHRRTKTTPRPGRNLAVAGQMNKYHRNGCDGPDLPWLKEFVRQHNLGKNVIFTGGVSNQRVRELMKGSDIFFLPSQWEGIALSIYEAMACGLAVLGADVGGQRELVIESCGLLLPRSDAAGEAHAYADVLADLTFNPESAAPRQGLLAGASPPSLRWIKWENAWPL